MGVVFLGGAYATYPYLGLAAIINFFAYQILVGEGYPNFFDFQVLVFKICA